MPVEDKSGNVAIAHGAIVGAALLLITFGESAVVTWSIAQHDPGAAYAAGGYHPYAYGSHAPFSIHVLAFMVSGIIFPALFEELYFRRILLTAFLGKYSFIRSAVTLSIIFTLLHAGKNIYITTFLFSLVTCRMFYVHGRLAPCIAAHATFNLLAFINQHYFDFHRIRTVSEIAFLSSWIPQFIMLVIGALILIREWQSWPPVKILRPVLPERA